MNNSKRIQYSSCLGQFALCLTLLFAGFTQQTQVSIPPPIPIRTIQPVAETKSVAELFPVTLQRDREANISFRVGGVIETLNIRAGQWVKSGQLLATLQQTPYISNKTKAAAEFNKLQNAVQRNQELLKAGAISTATHQDTQDALASARAALNAAQYDEDSATIKAPFTGIVLTREAEKGETIAPGQRVFRIADQDSLVVAKAAIPAQIAQRLHIGDAAQIRVGFESKVLPASIRFVGALSDSRTATVTVELLVQQAAAIASGTVGSVEFLSKSDRKSSDNLLLPPEALLEAKDGVGYVYVLDAQNSTARRTPIKVLGFEGELLRISGLQKGIKVLTAGAGFVSEGQKVQEILP